MATHGSGTMIELLRRNHARTTLSAVVFCILIAPALWGLDPGDGAAGISLYNQGRFQEAKELLEGVLQTGRAGTVEMAVLGMAYTRLGEHARAREILLRAKKREPWSSLVYVALGMLEFELRDYESAYQWFDLAYRIEPGSRQAREGMAASLVNRAIAVYREGRAEQAEELLLEARRIAPEAVSVLQNLSLIQQERGDLEQAAASLEQALRLEPRNPVLIVMLIRVRREQGRNTEVSELYRHLLEVQPDNAQAAAELGMLLVEQGQPDAAERAFRKAESLDTEEPYPYLYLARLSRQRGEPASVVISRLHSAIGKAVRKSGMIQMQAAGTIREREGQLGPEELQALQRLSALAEEPRGILAEALALLADSHESTEDHEQDLRRLSSWYPHSLELRGAVGRLLESEERFEDAREHWRRILEEFPTAIEAHLGLARSLEGLEKAAEAKIAYRRARDLDPENPEIYRALHRLYEAAGREQALLEWYGELYARERTNVALLEAWADLEERLGYPEQAARHRLRARELEQRD